MPWGCRTQCILPAGISRTGCSSYRYHQWITGNNTKTVTDEAGEYDDWVELYNTTKSEIDLSGAFLTDDPSNISNGLSVGIKDPSGEYLIVWWWESSQGKYHTNFKLSAEGESVWLIRKDSVLMDSVTFDPTDRWSCICTGYLMEQALPDQKPTFQK